MAPYQPRFAAWLSSIGLAANTDLCALPASWKDDFRKWIRDALSYAEARQRGVVRRCGDLSIIDHSAFTAACWEFANES